MRIFGSIILIIGGVVIIVYHQQLYKIFGPIDRAEKQFGDSRAVYVLSGCGMITLGIFMLFAGGGGGVENSQQLQMGS